MSEGILRRPNERGSLSRGEGWQLGQVLELAREPLLTRRRLTAQNTSHATLTSKLAYACMMGPRRPQESPWMTQKRMTEGRPWP